MIKTNVPRYEGNDHLPGPRMDKTMNVMQANPVGEMERMHKYMSSEWFDRNDPKLQEQALRYYAAQSPHPVQGTESMEQVLGRFYGGQTQEQAFERLWGTLENLNNTKQFLTAKNMELREVEIDEQAETNVRDDKEKKQKRVKMVGRIFGTPYQGATDLDTEPTEEEIEAERNSLWGKAWAESPKLMLEHGQRTLAPRHFSMAAQIAATNDPEGVAREFSEDLAGLNVQEASAFMGVLGALNPELDRGFGKRILLESRDMVGRRMVSAGKSLKSLGMDLGTYYDTANEFAVRLESEFKPEELSKLWNEEGEIAHGFKARFNRVVEQAGGQLPANSMHGFLQRQAAVDGDTVRPHERAKIEYFRTNARDIYASVLERRKTDKFMYDVENATMPRYSQLQDWQEFTVKGAAITSDMLVVAALNRVTMGIGGTGYAFTSHQYELEQEMVNRFGVNHGTARVASVTAAIPYALVEKLQGDMLDPKYFKMLYKGRDQVGRSMLHYLGEFAKRKGVAIGAETGEEWMQAGIDYAMYHALDDLLEANGGIRDAKYEEFKAELVDSAKYMWFATLFGGGTITGGRAAKNRDASLLVAPELRAAWQDAGKIKSSSAERWGRIVQNRKTAQVIESGAFDVKELDAIPARELEAVRDAETDADAVEALRALGVTDPETRREQAQAKLDIIGMVADAEVERIQTIQESAEGELAEDDDGGFADSPKMSFVQKARDQFADALGIDVQIFATQADAVAAHAWADPGEGAKLEGVISSDGKTVVLVEENLTDARHALQKFYHEVFSHKGLDLNPKRKEYIKKVLDEVGADGIRAVLPEFYSGKNPDGSYRYSEEQLADEYLAFLAEQAVRSDFKTEADRTAWQKFSRWIGDTFGLDEQAVRSGRQMAEIARDVLEYSKAVSKADAELYPEGTKVKANGKTYSRQNGEWKAENGRAVKNSALIADIEQEADNQARKEADRARKKRAKAVEAQLEREATEDTVIQTVLENGGVRFDSDTGKAAGKQDWEDFPPMFTAKQTKKSGIPAFIARFTGKNESNGLPFDVMVEHVNSALSTSSETQELFDENSLAEYLFNFAARAQDLRDGTRKTDDELAEEEAAAFENSGSQNANFDPQTGLPVVDESQDDWDEDDPLFSVARKDLTVSGDANRTEALEVLEKLAGVDLMNDETGISARINTKQRNKVLSRAALDKTVKNGFSPGQHNAAAARIDKLWKHAVQLEQRPSKAEHSAGVDILRFGVPVVFGGETGIAIITAKGSEQHGHRIYSLELNEIKKMLRRKGNEPESELTGYATSEAIEKLAEFAEKVKPRLSVAPPTGSEAFKKWFGDSKVVDENGAPLVVYHGTRNSFSQFDREAIGRNFKGFSFGFHFTDIPGDADSYSIHNRDSSGSAPQTIPVYLDIKNPLVISEPRSYASAIVDLNRAELIHKVVESRKTDNPYDGIIAETYNGERNFVVFNPAQIKSIYNQGTWDAENPDIRFSASSASAQWHDAPRTKKLFDNNLMRVYEAERNGNVIYETSIKYGGTWHTVQYASTEEEARGLAFYKDEPWYNGVKFWFQSRADRLGIMSDVVPDVPEKVVHAENAELGNSQPLEIMQAAEDLSKYPNGGYKAGSRFSAAQRSNAGRETAAMFAKKIFEGERPTVKDVQAVLDRTGDKAAKAHIVLDNARELAQEVIAKRKALQDDRAINREIRSAEVRQHHRRRVEEVQKQAMEGGALWGEMKARLEARIKRVAGEGMQRIRGLDADELKKYGIELDGLLDALELVEVKNEPRKVDPDKELDEDEDPEAGNSDGEETLEAPIYKEEVEDFLHRVKSAAARAAIDEGLVDNDTMNKVLKKESVRRKYARTLEKLLRKTVRQLNHGQTRAELEKAVDRLGKMKQINSIDSHAYVILDRSFNERVRADRQTLIDEMWDMTSQFKGRIASLREENKRDVAASAEKYFKMVRRIMAGSYPESLEKLGLDSDAPIEDVQQAINDIISTLDSAEVPKGENALRWQSGLMAELDALYRFGNLKFKTLAEVAEAHGFLQTAVEAALEEQAKRVGAHLRKVELIKADLHDSMPQTIKPKAKRTAGEQVKDWVSKVLPLQYRLEEIPLHGKGASAENAGKWLKSVADRVSSATFAAENEVFRSSMELRTALEEIYGEEAETVMRDLAEKREEYRRFSFENAPLSKAQLLQILATIQQEQYAESMPRRAMMEGDLLNAVSTQDLKLLGWLREYYANAREELSAVNERVTGLPVDAPDPLYMPVGIEMERHGFESLMHVLSFVPKSLSPRVRHQKDLAETDDIFALFNDRLHSNAQFKHFAELGIEIRDTLGEYWVKKDIARVHGDEFLAQLESHLMDVFMGKAPPKKHEKAAKFMAKYTAYTSLSWNFRMLLRQPTSFPAFGFHMPLSDVWSYARDGVKNVLDPNSEARLAMAEILESDHAKTRMGSGYIHVMRDILNSGDSNMIERFFQKGMKLNTFGDIVPTLIVGQGYYRTLAAQAIRDGKPEAEAKAWALDRMWQVMNLSQQSPSIMNQSEYIRRSDDIALLLAQFTTTPQQYLAQQLHEWNKMRAGKDNAFKRTVFLNHVVLPLLYHGVNMIINAVQGDETEKEDWLKLLAALIAGPATGWMFAGAAIEIGIKTVLTGRRPAPHDTSLVPAERILSDLGTVTHLITTIPSLDAEDILKDVRRLGDSFAPVREVNNVVDNVTE